MKAKKKVQPKPISPYLLKKRWDLKRESIYNLRDNIERLKYRVREDLCSQNEKECLTALVIRIMLITSERIGNDKSAKKGHFGITQFKPKHITVEGNKVFLTYKGKSGVEHQKEFSDETSAKLLEKLLLRNKKYVFVTAEGFKINPDRVNRYLKDFYAKSKDIRGFNANRMVIMKLNNLGRVKDPKERPKVFNKVLKSIASKIGHGAMTLRAHYLLPEIEENFYSTGSVCNIKID